MEMGQTEDILASQWEGYTKMLLAVELCLRRKEPARSSISLQSMTIIFRGTLNLRRGTR